MIDSLEQPLIRPQITQISADSAQEYGENNLRESAQSADKNSPEQQGRAAVDAAQTVLADTERKTASREMVIAFREALSGNGWKTAREIREATGIDDRVLRLCAESSDGEIISGQLGYKLTAEATPAEIIHAESWLLSQAKRMTDRARQIRVAMNRRRFTAS